ncbi:MAG: HAMP domain-containing histidine kinase [Bacteroides sp.]|nr:HAMP domain-containing histidine kinase [Bacteroides sp.]
MKRLLYLLVMLTAVTAIHANNSLTVAERKVIADSLRAELRKATTPGDSVATMCNLYDVMSRKSSTILGDSLYRTAIRAGERSTALNIIRNQASRYMRNDSMLKVLTRVAKEFSDGDDKKETLTYIKMMSNIRRAQYSDRHDRDEAMRNYLEELSTNTNADIYDRIALTHGICMILSEDTNGEIVVAYMDSLANLLNKLPASAYSIRNIYNLHAASLFAYTQPKKSMEADLNNLKIFKKLQNQYAEQGRQYRTYHSAIYDIYTRLLSNFDYLTPDEVETYYKKALEEVPQDPEIQDRYDEAPMPEIYYAMAHKDYAKALPLIKKTVDLPLEKNTRIRLLQYGIECARELGDRHTLFDMTEEYAGALNEKLENLSNSSYRELRIAYSISDMRHNLETMELQQRESHATMQRIIIAVSLCAVVLMAILIVFLFRLYRRNHKLASNLKNANNQLLTESEKLRQSRADLIRARDQAQKANNLKTDFIKNMSYEVKVPLQAINEYSHLIADCVAHVEPESGIQSSTPAAKHLTRFADLIELNSELLTTIIDDVLRLSEIESSSLPIQSQVIQLRRMCEGTLASIKRRTKPGVTMMLDPNVKDIDLFSDPTRLQQILNNLLTNATKFTSSGSIVLSYSLNKDEDAVTFSVTDTGIGINPQNKDKIFDRFVKLDHDSQGAGLGLTIARLLARHLGGDLTLDTSYTDGARFILTIPKK